MRLIHTVASAGIIILALAGCTATGTPAAAPKPASLKPVVVTSTPTPTPTAMSTAQAAKYFLDTVCPANKTVVALNASVDAYNADTSKGVTVITVSAAAARDAEQAAAKRLDNASVIWPAGFDADVTTLRDSYYEDVVTAGQIASAKSIADVNAVTPGPDQAKGAEASARMRARLNLPADTQSSCKGY